MKKFLATVLALTLMLSLCSGISFAEDKPVLTIGDVNEHTADYSARFWQWLGDQIGCEIQYVYYTDDNYAAALASGDLCDIVHPKNDLSTILEAGLAKDLLPYLDNELCNLKKEPAWSSIQLLIELQGGGDHFYFIPAGLGYNGEGYGTSFNTRGYVVRWDYYKELGCPVIHNEDEYLDVLVQMWKNHPVNESGEPNYIYGTDNFKGYDVAFRTYLSLDYWAAYKYQNNIFTNEIYDGFVDVDHSQWWANTAWYWKVYHATENAEGFDMDLFTMTGDEFSVKREKGQYMGLHNGNSALYNASYKEDPETIKGYCTIPDAPSNYYTNVYQIFGNGSMYMGFISANCKNLEGALKFYNAMYDPDVLRAMLYGEPGVIWDYDAEGKPGFTEDGWEQYKAFNIDGNKEESSYFYNWSGMPNNTFGLRDNQLDWNGNLIKLYGTEADNRADFANTKDNVAKDMVAFYSERYPDAEIEIPTDAFFAVGNLDFRNDCGEAISTLMTGLDSDQLAVIAAANEVFERNQADCILADTWEDFVTLRDQAIAEIREVGEEEVFAAYQAQWNEYAEIVFPLVKAAQTANGRIPYTEEVYGKLPIAE